MGLIIGGASASDLILDGQSVSLYVGGNPPTKVWPTAKEVVQITLGTGTQAYDQLRAALADRGLDYWTVTEIPFDIELVGTGSAREMFFYYSALTSVPAMDTSQVTDMNNMFYGCSALTSVPAMDTSQVTDMGFMFQFCSSLTHVPDMDTSQVTTTKSMFYDCAALTHVPNMDTSQVTDMAFMLYGCSSLTYVPDMDTGQVTDMSGMFYDCAALTDGNVRLIGRRPQVNTEDMIAGSGLTREPWYNADGTPLDVVQITMGSGMEARDQFRAALTARGLDYTTITEVPFEIELVGTGASQHLFYGCRELTSVPPLDTSNVTNSNGMFQLCGSLVTIPPLDTSNIWNAPSMFAYCNSLTSVPDMDATKMTNVSHMFTGCTALTDGNVRLIGRNPTVNTSSMISSSGLTREPWYNADGTPFGPREVVITKSPVGYWEQGTVAGDTSLIQRWVGDQNVVFVAAVTCDEIVYSSDTHTTQDPGTVLRAGAEVRPFLRVIYTFTEVL